MADYTQGTIYSRSFLMVLTSDHVTGATGKTVTVTISKAGGAFAAAAGVVSEIGNGWYRIRLTVVDNDTPGDLAFHCTAAACDDTDFVDQVNAATSSSTGGTGSGGVYTITAEDIIRDAMLLIQATDEDEAISGAGTDFAVRRLNNILRHFSTRGLNMWRRKEVVLPLVGSQAMYLLGNASTDAEWADEEDFVATTTSVAASAGASTITVTSPTGITASDRIGVKLTTGVRQWTTVNGAPAGSVVTLTDVLAGDVASGASVYSYTTRPERPLRVIHARRRATATGIDVQVDTCSEEEYQAQPSKLSSGTVTMYTYKPTLTSGRLFIWQAGTIDHLLRMTVERPFEVISTTDTVPDVPDEWYEALTHRLAVNLEPTYGQLDANRVARLQANADRMQLEAEMFDSDMGSLRLQAARRR